MISSYEDSNVEDDPVRCLDHLGLRKYIIDYTTQEDVEGFLSEEYTFESWKDKMKENHVQVDNVFIAMAAKKCERMIRIIPVFPEDDHGYLTFPYESECWNPKKTMYFLYYDEVRFQLGHYQSIRPLNEKDAERYTFKPAPRATSTFDIQNAELS